jgi:IS5 family transposase
MLAVHTHQEAVMAEAVAGATTAAELEKAYTFDELMDMAQAQDVKGRSSMNKEGLARELAHLNRTGSLVSAIAAYFQSLHNGALTLEQIANGSKADEAALANAALGR